MTAIQWPSATEGFEKLGQWWHPIKMGMEHSFGFSPDALHVLVGVGLQLVLAKLLDASVARTFPLLGVLAMELLNEWSDLSFEIWPNRTMQWGESAKDVFLTMALPTVLLIVSRRWPEILRGSRGPASDIPETPMIGEEGVVEASDDTAPGAFVRCETGNKP